jgi:flagellin
MSRINTNVASLIAQRSLAKNNAQLNMSLKRLSSGLKINTGADDPAGLIASENLKAEAVGIQTAIGNAQRAGNIIGTAEGGLSEVSSLLNQLQGLVGQAANSGGLSNDEIAANQLQVDSILGTINRIAGSTSFEGQKLLNGSLAYSTSGVSSTAINSLQINSALLPANAATNIVIGVTQSAQTATIGYAGGALAASNNITIEVDGNVGSAQVSITGGTTVANIISAINTVKAATGVSATASGANLRLDSVDFGSKQFVAVKTVAGTFATTASSAFGRDAAVNVNGAAAQVDGTHASLRNATLDLSFNIGSSINTNSGTTSFYITGGGARFSLGEKVTETDKASIGINSVTTGNLGDSINGFLSSLQSGQANQLSAANLVGAQKIIDKSINQVSTLRGRLGAFQKFTIGSTVNSLQVALENNQAAESAIADTDFAEETANLTRAQILSQAATSVLSQANTAPQAALLLLPR